MVRDDLLICVVAPWGRIVKARKDLFDPALGRRYWEWTEEQVKPYV